MAVLMPSSRQWSDCTPRFATPRTPTRPNRLAEFDAIAAGLGFELMPWQRQVVEVATEYDPATGIPSYRELVVTVPRQSGKTILILVFMLHRALMWGKPQSIAYTAQTGNDARMKLIDDHYDKILSRSSLHGTIEKAKRAMGATAIVFRNGSRIDALATSVDAGHGKTLDLAVIDEAMADADSRREQALLPTMTTRADAQLLVFSTAGTESSTMLRRKVDAGRDSVAAGRTSGTAYFEWSADPDDDLDDRAVWWRIMPALGHSTEEPAIEHARSSMSPDEFRRAYLNQWVHSSSAAIPPDVWAGVQDEVTPAGVLVFGVDAGVDQAFGSIAVSDATLNVALVDRRPGVGWLRDRLLELVASQGGKVAIDPSGPVGYLTDALKSRGVTVVETGPRALAHSCQFFVAAVADRKLRIRSHPQLDESVAGAVKVSAGDSWRWGRKSADVDVAPLVAVTLAVGAHSMSEDPLSQIW